MAVNLKMQIHACPKMLNNDQNPTGNKDLGTSGEQVWLGSNPREERHPGYGRHQATANKAQRINKSKKYTGCNTSSSLGCWNVRTLQDKEDVRPIRRTALLCKELEHFKVDIAAICETRFEGSDQLVEQGYTLFWKGKTKEEKRESGVGFVLKNTIVEKLE